MKAALLLAVLALAAAPSATWAQDAPSDGDETIAPAGEVPSSDAASSEAEGEAPPGPAAEEAAEESATADAPSPPPRARLDHDANVPATTAASAFGVATLLAAVGAGVGIATWVERDEAISRCASYELEDPRHRACLNVGVIRDQRDVGVGLTLGFGALTVGAAIAWIVASVTSPAAEPSAFTCAPGLLSFGCAGRF